MARLLADENFSFPTIVHLRQLGHDAITIQSRGLGNRQTTDERVLDEAIALDRAVLTFNRRHFIRLHRQNQVHAGIIVCTRDPDHRALAQRIDAAIGKLSSPHNQLIRVYRPSQP